MKSAVKAQVMNENEIKIINTTEEVYRIDELLEEEKRLSDYLQYLQNEIKYTEDELNKIKEVLRHT